jgi:hypothetical protein
MPTIEDFFTKQLNEDLWDLIIQMTADDQDIQLLSKFEADVFRSVPTPRPVKEFLKKKCQTIFYNLWWFDGKLRGWDSPEVKGLVVPASRWSAIELFTDIPVGFCYSTGEEIFKRVVSHYVQLEMTGEFCQRLHQLHGRLGVHSSRVELYSIQVKIQSHALYTRLLQKQGDGALRLDFKLSCVLATTLKPRNDVDLPPTTENHISYSVVNYPEILEETYVELVKKNRALASQDIFV